MQVTKFFALTFNEPNKEWLCGDNLKLALEQVCTNTTFKVEQMGKEMYEDIWKLERLSTEFVNIEASLSNLELDEETHNKLLSQSKSLCEQMDKIKEDWGLEFDGDGNIIMKGNVALIYEPLEKERL